jgi:hypothetical protein
VHGLGFFGIPATASLRRPRGRGITCGDETVTMRNGELWWFDNKTPHQSRNDGDCWRMHIIFDVTRPQQLAEQGSFADD